MYYVSLSNAGITDRENATDEELCLIAALRKKKLGVLLLTGIGWVICAVLLLLPMLMLITGDPETLGQFAAFVAVIPFAVGIIHIFYGILGKRSVNRQ